MRQSICVSCKKPYIRNPRQKKQQYCSDPACQKARKATWQREQMRSNPTYKKDQMQAKQDWFDQHPDFWKKYRRKNQQKTLRNVLLQRKRNQQYRLKRLEKKPAEKVIAKMDVLDANNHGVLREYWVVPVIAKMDVLRGYLTVSKGKHSHFL